MDALHTYKVNVNDIKPLDVDESDGFRGVDSRLLLCNETVGQTTCCMFRAIFPAGAYHAKHVHHKSDELLYCISGSAIQSVGDVEYRMRPGDAMILPKDIPHYMRNDGSEPFVVLGIYPNASDFDDTDQHLVTD